MRLAGVIEGEIEATGDVEIDDQAKVKASVAGRDVSIRGHVNGAVVARKRLVVARSGSLVGDVRVQRLVIQDGATFSGKVSMGAPAEAPPRGPVAPEPFAQEPEIPATVVKAPAPIVSAAITAAPLASKDGKDSKAKAKATPPPKVKPKPKRR